MGHHAARIQAQLDDALDLAKATPAQRAAVTAERDRLISQWKPERGERKESVQELLALLQSDKPDPAAIAKLQRQHQTRVAELAKATKEAFVKLHSLFGPGQRKVLAAYVRDEMPSRQSNWREKMAKFMVDRHLDEALAVIKATEAQKVQIRTLVEQGFDAERKAMQVAREDVEVALRQFEAAQLDPVALTALETKQLRASQARGERAATIAQQIHAQLTADQRKALAAHMQKAAKRFGPEGGPQGKRGGRPGGPQGHQQPGGSVDDTY
jgi:Spy/CpxP family protein refolding chaperone